MVQSNGQVRRLAKRKLTRLTTHNETLTLKASGLRALGERYIRLQLGGDEVDELEDIVLEVIGDYEIGDNGMSVTLQVAKADPNIDEWNAYTDEGAGPADASSPVQNELVAPTITGVTPIDELVGTGVDSIRLSVAANPPAAYADRDDLTWFAQWRVTGTESWNTLTYTALPTGSVVMNTGFVPIDQMLDVQAAYQTGGGNLLRRSRPPCAGQHRRRRIAPSAPMDIAGLTSARLQGLARVHWRNLDLQQSSDHCARILRGGVTSAFGAAAGHQRRALGIPAGANETFNDSAKGWRPGLYYYWRRPENTANTASPPDGPASVVVCLRIDRGFSVPFTREAMIQAVISPTARIRSYRDDAVQGAYIEAGPNRPGKAEAFASCSHDIEQRLPASLSWRRSPAGRRRRSSAVSSRTFKSGYLAHPDHDAPGFVVADGLNNGIYYSARPGSGAIRSWSSSRRCIWHNAWSDVQGHA